MNQTEDASTYQRPRLVVAGTSSGAGKTTFTLGLMAALRSLGHSVQGYKVGPDYIDPSYHQAVTGRPSRNLDTWMLDASVVQEIFFRSSQGADISIVEGVMGLYDGKEALSNRGSTAELSGLLDAPVLLVVNAASMARSAAAIVLGFQSMDPRVRVRGVLLNGVGSDHHFHLLKEAIEDVAGVPVLGYLRANREISIPERHLGLLPALERGELDTLFAMLSRMVSETVDLDAVMRIANEAPPVRGVDPHVFVPRGELEHVTIAVARDAAFNFYYPENLELLALYGAKLAFFSPLAGDSIPDEADGVYFGGGFPEEFAAQLGSQTPLLKDVYQRITDGLPTYAECGGLMFLTRSITDRAGATYPMVGVIPASIRMQERRAALGYREVTAIKDGLLLLEGESLRGHEFHYSTISYEEEGLPNAYSSIGTRLNRREGYVSSNVLASYTHVHFASNPKAVSRFVGECQRYRSGKRGHAVPRADPGP